MTEYRKNVDAWCVDCDADMSGSVRERCAECLVDHVFVDVGKPTRIGKPTGFAGKPGADQ